MEKYGTARQTTNGNITRRMRFACWITWATGTYLENVILIAFPRQQWLRERATVLRYMHIACLVFSYASFCSPEVHQFSKRMFRGLLESQELCGRGLIEIHVLHVSTDHTDVTFTCHQTILTSCLALPAVPRVVTVLGPQLRADRPAALRRTKLHTTKTPPAI